MDVSALSTPIRPEGGRGPMLDVRAEFFDNERDETKALGQLSVWCSWTPTRWAG
jgi:hypothetical protein